MKLDRERAREGGRKDGRKDGQKEKRKIDRNVLEHEDLVAASERTHLPDHGVAVRPQDLVAAHARGIGQLPGIPHHLLFGHIEGSQVSVIVVVVVVVVVVVDGWKVGR
jgi:hypothetical protein